MRKKLHPLEIAAIDPASLPQYRKWRFSHHGKVRYTSQWRAWWVVFCICLRERQVDWTLAPYACRWGPDWRKNHAYPEHFHIGHRKRAPQRKIWHWWHRLTTWQFYRMRTRYRRWKKSLMNDN